MLVVRPEQMQVFAEAARTSYEEELIAHCQEHAPKVAQRLGNRLLRVVVRRAMRRADHHGFTNRGPGRLFLDVSLLLGGTFDLDPQYPWASAILRTNEHQTRRADRLWQAMCRYREQVWGEDAINLRAATEQLAAFFRSGADPSIKHHEDLWTALNQVSPQKVHYAGESALRAMLHEAREGAVKHRLSAHRGWHLLTMLMFAFGHGCTDDPLYPWIRGVLRDESLFDETARENSLADKTAAWLERSLA